jgi:hypothetical protein
MQNNNIPKINKNFIHNVFNTLTKKTLRGRQVKGNKKTELNILNSFFNNTYVKLMDGYIEGTDFNVFKIDGTNLSQILSSYLTTELVTSIENNIKLHFINHLNNFINCGLQYTNNKILKKIKSKERIQEVHKIKYQMNLVREDILLNTFTSNKIYHNFIIKYKNLILPKIPIDTTHQNILNNDPQKYLKHMIYMNLEMKNIKNEIVKKIKEKKYSEEKQNKKINEIKIKELQVIPLRTSNVIKNIPIDTKTLIELFMDNKNYYLSNLMKTKHEIWNKLFNLKNNIFKRNNYNFDYRIVTDLYSVSIEFIHNSKIDNQNNKKINMSIKRTEKIKENKNKTQEEIENAKELNEKEKLKNKITERSKFDKKTKEEKKVIMKKIIEYPYFDELTEAQENLLKDQTVKKLYLDPGKKNLIYIMDDNKQTFRYSNQQRLFETKRLKFQKEIEEYKKKKGIGKIENDLSNYKSKSCKIKEFEEYIKKKNEVHEKVKERYEELKINKLKWYTYVNTLRSEDKMINKIKEKYSPNKEKIIIMYGDWSIGKQMRNFISTPNISLKRKISNYFTVYNIDEYKTSKINYKTEEEGKNLIIKDPKWTKSDSQIKRKYPEGTRFACRSIHSVLTYKMENNRLGCIHREKNSVYNMKKITNQWIQNRTRPEKYCRQKTKKDDNPKVSNVIKSITIKIENKQKPKKILINHINSY